MLQLTQKLGSGEMKVQEVPIPQLGAGQVLVQTYYSLISAGTEGSTVKAARKSLIGKAKERPQQVKQVLDVLKKQGPIQTYRAVTKKLDAYSPLGYSCSGKIIQVGQNVTTLKVGDLVSCAGVGYANHAEINAVPVNLCVKLDDNADLKMASYNTLGAIAMQGVRQADLRLGESCVIIGLGLLGQLTCLFLRASGVNAIGIDIDENAVAVAKKHAADDAYHRNAAGLENTILEKTNGAGVDAVIIAAATSSLDPINFAGAITRKKGTVVVLGAVPTGFDRDPHYYRKELSLKMACSYGPGRYDPTYEEKGIDYPIAYVRWTENRNMQAFQHLLQQKRIDLSYLTTHTFAFDKANSAYDLMLDKSEQYLGIALEYDVDKKHQRGVITTNTNSGLGKINIAFIGAGSYAQGNLLPNIPADSRISKKGILTNSGTTSKRVAEKFGFDFCTDEAQKLLSSNDIDTVFIATRHDSHASFVLESLKNKKHVFVEKPLCLTKPELKEIKEAYHESGTSIAVGYNRRFSPFIQRAKKELPSGPMSIIYRVNAGYIPKESWIQDKEIGGGRILGEVCHFIDLLTFLNGSIPKTVSANAMHDPEGLNDTINILLSFENGSTGTVSYFANGARSLAKEYLEIHSSGSSVVISDFKHMSSFNHKKENRQKKLNQDKGQAQMVKSFCNALLAESDNIIPFQELYYVQLACFAAIESINENGKMISLKDYD